MKLSSLLPGYLFALMIVGCDRGEGPSPTRGTVTIECDESVWPVMKLQAEEFHHSYPDANVNLRSVEAREAIADFVNDSVRVIVSGRALNTEEREALMHAKVEFQEYKVALDAVAVIVHRNNPQAQMRISELDSIFSGDITRWSGKLKNALIDVAIGGINSSTNEVLRTKILNNKRLTLAATAFPSSEKLIEYVKATPTAIGIVGLSWLKGTDPLVTKVALGDPKSRPDSTQPVGKYYTPVQAYVHLNYYPLTKPIYMYTREVVRHVGIGFISFVNSGPGQKIFLNDGLVPVTMPVRIVELTSHQVKI